MPSSTSLGSAGPQRYRSTLLLVLGSSFVVQLFRLPILLIQVIIDKVIASTHCAGNRTGGRDHF